MDRDTFVETLKEETETALSRLGSSKSLYATTGGEMESEAVLRAAADAEYHAAETFEQWARDEPSDGEAEAAFAAVAQDERDHYATLTTEFDSHDVDDEPPAMQAHLRDLDDTVERAGALVGRILATRKSKDQMVGFFVGQADPGTADTFRDLRDDLDPQLDRALDLLESVCEDDEDWERARDAAAATVQVAYDEYTRQLESMGVDPKPVC